MKPGPFEVMGLELSATPEEVKQRWRDLCMIWHPDRPTGNAVEFNTIRQAYKKCMAIALEPKLCADCKGSGQLLKQHGFNTITIVCPACSGVGHE